MSVAEYVVLSELAHENTGPSLSPVNWTGISASSPPSPSGSVLRQVDRSGIQLHRNTDPSLSPFDWSGISASTPPLGSILAYRDQPSPKMEMVRPIPNVSTESMTGDQVLQKAAEPGVNAIAINIPVTLIAPPAFTALDAPTADPSTAPPNSAWALDAIGAPVSPHDGTGVVIAVLDTGINQAHPAFMGVDFLARDFTGTGSAADDNGHGTHCAAIIAGRDVKDQRIGVARGVTRILNGKVLDREGHGTSAQLYDAMIWAVREGANIISISVGFDFVAFATAYQAKGLPQSASISRALEGYRANLRMFDKLVAMLSAEQSLVGSALIFAAAGNESHAAAEPPFRIGVSLPAAAEKVIAVGAVDLGPTGLTVAPFSNTFVQVCAPGVGIISASYLNNGLVAMTGTSAACPFAAGVAALWWQSLTASAMLVTPGTVWAQMAATAESACFAPTTATSDRGVGLVKAPPPPPGRAAAPPRPSLAGHAGSRAPVGPAPRKPRRRAPP